MHDTDYPSRRRRWPVMAIAALVLLAILWSGFWYFAAGTTAKTVADWKAREAQAGRHFVCSKESVSGYPFRIEVRCEGASADLKSNQPPVTVKAGAIRFLARVWEPTQLTSEIDGPLTISEPGQLGTMTARWRSARTELHGLPISPESVRVTIDGTTVEREAVDAGGSEQLFKADRFEVVGRMVSGSAASNPVIEVTFKLVSAAAPSLHPATVKPLDAEVTAVLRGLKNFAPKPWPDRFRELQAAGGRIEIIAARVRQGDTIATAKGVLSLSRTGRLDGQLRLVIANLDKVMPSLGLDKMLTPQAAPTQLNNAFGALDRILPGLGNVARQNAGPAIVAGINIMGQPTELEGQRAVALPLRFNDGAVSLGPVPLGQTAPLF
jgi:hypothetical protein